MTNRLDVQLCLKWPALWFGAGGHHWLTYSWYGNSQQQYSFMQITGFRFSTLSPTEHKFASNFTRNSYRKWIVATDMVKAIQKASLRRMTIIKLQFGIVLKLAGLTGIKKKNVKSFEQTVYIYMANWLLITLYENKRRLLRTFFDLTEKMSIHSVSCS